MKWIEIICTNPNCNRQVVEPGTYDGEILNRPLPGCCTCFGGGTIKIQKEFFESKTGKFLQKGLEVTIK